MSCFEDDDLVPAQPFMSSLIIPSVHSDGRKSNRPITSRSSATIKSKIDGQHSEEINSPSKKISFFGQKSLSFQMMKKNKPRISNFSPNLRAQDSLSSDTPKSMSSSFSAAHKSLVASSVQKKSRFSIMREEEEKVSA